MEAFELKKSKKIGICLSFDYAVSMDGSDYENVVEIRTEGNVFTRVFF